MQLFFVKPSYRALYRSMGLKIRDRVSQLEMNSQTYLITKMENPNSALGRRL
jgi:hypothetical protein